MTTSTASYPASRTESEAGGNSQSASHAGFRKEPGASPGPLLHSEYHLQVATGCWPSDDSRDTSPAVGTEAPLPPGVQVEGNQPLDPARRGSLKVTHGPRQGKANPAGGPYRVPHSTTDETVVRGRGERVDLPIAGYLGGGGRWRNQEEQDEKGE